MEDALPSGLLEVCLLVGVPREQLRTQLQVRGVGGCRTRLSMGLLLSAWLSWMFNSGLDEISRSPTPLARLLSTDQQNCCFASVLSLHAAEML